MNSFDLKANLSRSADTRSLTGSDYRTLVLAALGGALEFYDFIVFVFFAPIIGQVFFPVGIPDWLRDLQTLGIFAVGYLARPIGGIVLAHFGDLLGRKRLFVWSVLLMSLPTFLMGLAPTYAQAGVIAPLFLLIVRILQGAAVGGEVPGAWVFVSEHVPRRRIGFACGTLVAGLAIGILLGSVISAIVNRSYGTQEVVTYMWRLPFLIGGLFGLFSMFLRRWLRETPVFVELRQRKSLAAEIPLRAVLRAHRRAVVVSMALTSMLAAQIGVVILTTPQLLQRHFHFTAESTLTANCAASLASAFGCIASGLIADRFGARRTIVIGSLALVACYYSMFREVGGQPALLVSLYTLSGLAVGVVAVVPLVMVKMFPPVVRFSGVSFSYNVAYALLGGLTPVVVSLMTKSQPYAPVFYVTAFCILGVTSLPFIKESPLIVVSP